MPSRTARDGAPSVPAWRRVRTQSPVMLVAVQMPCSPASRRRKAMTTADPSSAIDGPRSSPVVTWVFCQLLPTFVTYQMPGVVPPSVAIWTKPPGSTARSCATDLWVA